MITIIALYIILGIIALIVILLHFSVRVTLKAKTGEKPFFEVKYLFFTIFPRKPKKHKNGKETKEENKEQYKSEFTDEDIEKLLENAQAIDTEEEKTDEKPAAELIEVKEETAASEASEIAEQADEAEAEKNKAEAAKVSEEQPEESGLTKLKSKFLMIKPYIPMAWKYFRKILKTIRITKLDIEITSGKEDAYEAAMMYGKLNAALYNVIALLSRIFTVRVLKKTKVNCVFNEKTFEYDVSTVVLVRPSTLIAIAFCVGVNFLRIFIPQKFRAWRKKRREEKENKRKLKNTETELLKNECN